MIYLKMCNHDTIDIMKAVITITNIQENASSQVFEIKEYLVFGVKAMCPIQ